jgi:hypothetical protein
MSTQTKEPTAESIREELVKLDAEIESMEAELEAGEKPLVWDEVGSVEGIAAEQHRLTILPRLIRAAKIKRAELRIRRTRAELEPLYAEREAAYKKLERTREKKRKVEEEEKSALAEWGAPHNLIQKRERRIKDAERELHELRGEA